MLRSPLPAAEVIDALRYWLAKAIAESTSMHGVFMDVLGMGVLISGESGLGKSELALELISRGHGLVADDVVDFKRIAPHAIEGRCPPLLRNMLEVRGLGLLDIRAIFGETAIRPKMKLKLIVHLVRRSMLENEYQRLPLEALTEDVLGPPDPQGRDPGGRGSQHGGAHRGGGAQHGAVAARIRHDGRVHRAPARADRELRKVGPRFPGALPGSIDSRRRAG